MVPFFFRQFKGNGFAGNRVAVPVRQLEIIVAPRQTGTVKRARPGRLADAVAPLPPPALVIIRVADLNLAHDGIFAHDAQCLVPVKSAAQIPLRPVKRVVHGNAKRRKRARHLSLRKLRHVLIAQHTVKNGNFVDIAAADKIIGAGNIPMGNRPAVRPELIQPRRIHARSEKLRLLFAVYIQLHAEILVPGKRNVHPRFRRGKGRQIHRHTRARQVQIRHKRIQSMTVVIDAQPTGVPAGMIQ